MPLAQASNQRRRPLASRPHATRLPPNARPRPAAGPAPHAKPPRASPKPPPPPKPPRRPQDAVNACMQLQAMEGGGVTFVEPVRMFSRSPPPSVKSGAFDGDSPSHKDGKTVA